MLCYVASQEEIKSWKGKRKITHLFYCRICSKIVDYTIRDACLVPFGTEYNFQLSFVFLQCWLIPVIIFWTVACVFQSKKWCKFAFGNCYIHVHTLVCKNAKSIHSWSVRHPLPVSVFSLPLINRRHLLELNLPVQKLSNYHLILVRSLGEMF